jgi:nucleotide-binding universal stress UspA family protein
MYRRIMLTSDGSQLAAAALPHAVALAEGSDATIVLVAAIDSRQELLAEGVSTGWLDLGGELAEEDLAEADAEQRATANAHLASLHDALERAGMPAVEEHIVTGAATEAIVDAVAALECDALVMATHGRGGLGRTLLGSVADHVARHAPCAVLLVRPVDTASTD